jgi:hypothetical protein
MHLMSTLMPQNRGRVVQLVTRPACDCLMVGSIPTMCGALVVWPEIWSLTPRLVKNWLGDPDLKAHIHGAKCRNRS